MDTIKETPLMKQYKAIKNDHKDYILFFRLGDFYEMFFEDAKIASKELGITLTSRNKEKNQNIPLAGVPYHSSGNYIAKLVSKGYKVAICEQVEDPKVAKGIVKREVVKIITPGTVVDSDFLDEKSNNFLAGVYIKGNNGAVAFTDISTGEFKVLEVSGSSENIFFKVISEVYKISPQELIVEEKTFETFQDNFNEYLQSSAVTFSTVSLLKGASKYLEEHFDIISLDSFGIGEYPLATETSAFTMEYLNSLNKGSKLPVTKISFVNVSNTVGLNYTTQRNLDLLKNQNDDSVKGSLLGVLDNCKTSLGSRLLRIFTANPLTKVEEINKRQDDVSYFIGNTLVRQETRDLLKDIYDLERLIGRVTMGTENGRDLSAIKKSLGSSLKLIALLKDNQIIKTKPQKLIDYYKLIDCAIREGAPFSIREGGFICDGYNLELDELRKISNSGKEFILALEAKEKEKTAIKSLKIKYNKVFGYFIEVSRSASGDVPENYTRKQTLTNAERYITPELKEYEEKVLGAKDKIEDLEYKLLKEVSGQLKEDIEIFQRLAYELAYLDLMSTFAENALNNSYIRPTLNSSYGLDIVGGRHPIVEHLLDSDAIFIKNDITLSEDKNLIILTGPNMAGKSTYMKQIALIIIMAQIGSFVPADKATIGIVDKIFTRVGANDDLVGGQSTFMVEMSEVANIVNNATENSFIILDEVGRGTSTFDGISIASSITTYIHNHIKAKTIFATHYHELTEMTNILERAVNYRVEVLEADDKITFLRKIVLGGADKSYGIEVARLAGLPNIILQDSKKLLKKLEQKHAIIEEKIKGEQLSLFGETTMETATSQDSCGKEKQFNKTQDEVLNEISRLDLNSITPIELTLKIYELKTKLSGAGGGNESNEEKTSL